MKKYEVTDRGLNRRVMYFDTIKELDVFRTIQVAELPRETFTVYINMLQKMPFQFDGEEFYLDVENVDRNIEQLDKLTELTKDKTKEEEVEIMKEHYVEFVRRDKVVIKVGDGTDVKEMVKGFISEHSL